MKDHILGLPEDHELGTGASEDGLQMLRKYKNYGEEIFQILKYFISEVLPVMVYRPFECVNYVLDFLQQHIYEDTLVSSMTTQISALGMGNFAEKENEEVAGATSVAVHAAEASVGGTASVAASVASSVSAHADEALVAVHADEASVGGTASVAASVGGTAAVSLYCKTVGTFGSFEFHPSLFDGANQSNLDVAVSHNTIEAQPNFATNKVKRTISDTQTKKQKNKKQKSRSPILCKCGKTKLSCRGYLRDVKIRRECEATLPSGEIVLKPYTGRIINYNCSEENFEITFYDSTNPFGNISIVDLNLYHSAYCAHKKKDYIELTLP